MPRLLWKGAISFGLVHVPVTLYPASRRDDIAFDLLDRRTLDPVGYQRVNKETGEEVEKEDIVKGYEYEDARYVILSDEEIRSANIQATHSVDIVAFVDPKEIPFQYFESPYYLAPSTGGEKVYALLREALQRSGKAGIAHVVIQTKQHLALLMPSGPALVLNTLRWPSEVQPFDELNLPGTDAQPAALTEKELSIATQLVESMSREWDPKQYRDTFRDDVIALINRKISSGNTTVAAPDILTPAIEAPPNNTIDLTDMLRRSLRYPPQGKADQRGRGLYPPPRSRRAPAKPRRTPG
jgi:DNA end-binding protein Ku